MITLFNIFVGIFANNLLFPEKKEDFSETKRLIKKNFKRKE